MSQPPLWQVVFQKLKNCVDIRSPFAPLTGGKGTLLFYNSVQDMPENKIRPLCKNNSDMLLKTPFYHRMTHHPSPAWGFVRFSKLG